jgi:cysteine sulfinate desulfinase/cysteine desulfurase-like protein
MNESVWTWNDLSPEDGCTLVAFAMVAASLTEVANAISRIPHAQNRTVGKLLANARARKVTGDVAHLAQAHPGEIFWLSCEDEASWTAVPAPSA